jgi:hypothetical protein
MAFSEKGVRKTLQTCLDSECLGQDLNVGPQEYE